MRRKSESEIVVALEEAKEIEFMILQKFAEICERHNLRYSLAYGTLLGAVRHNGFIPWDDDIDVMMPREDYMKLMEISSQVLQGTRYKIASMHTDNNYFAPLSKMYDDTTRVYQYYGQNEGKATGIYIDIFVLDKLPDEGAEQFYNEAQEIRWKWSLAVRKIFAKHQSKNVIRDIFGSIIAVPYKIRGYKYYRNYYDCYCSRYCDFQTKNIAVVVYGEGLSKECMTIDDLNEYAIVTFEGKEFRAVAHPDRYLTKMYGNYMELPPEEQRVSKHPNKMVRIK